MSTREYFDHLRKDLLEDKDNAAQCALFGVKLIHIKEESIYRDLGYNSFVEFTEEEASNPREFFRYMALAQTLTNFSISPMHLCNCRMTDVRRILETPLTEENRKMILLHAPNMTSQEIRKDLRKLSIKPPNTEIDQAMFSWFNTKICAVTKTGVIDRAFELVRREYGNAYSATGLRKDISDGKVLELLCADELNRAGIKKQWPLALQKRGLIPLNIKVLRDVKEDIVMPVVSSYISLYHEDLEEVKGESIILGEILRVLCLNKIQDCEVRVAEEIKGYSSSEAQDGGI